MSTRIAQLVRAAREARSYEITKLGERDAVRIIAASGTQISFVTPAELAEFRAAIVAGPEIWTVDGLPACTFDGARRMAEGIDARGIRVSLAGTRDQLTPERATRIAATYGKLVARRDALAADVARRMAGLYNKSWRQGRQLTIADLTARIRLTCVAFTVEDPGDVDLYFDDGDLFGGHEIAVALDADGHIKDCSI